MLVAVIMLSPKAISYLTKTLLADMKFHSSCLSGDLKRLLLLLLIDYENFKVSPYC